ncbi:hypothetical protein CHUAL_006534 [Chamberlinius hualienensis]
MSGFQVRALYDFDAQADSELAIQTNEILTVVNTDVGEGWWEGQNRAGKTGLFPAAYVETLSTAPPSMPPPPLPAGYDRGEDHQLSSSYPTTPQAQSDDWDDDWDDDDDSPAEQEQQTNYRFDAGSAAAAGRESVRSSSVGDVSTMGKGDASKAPVRRNFNRFSTFVKSGSEDYIMGKYKVSVSSNEAVHLVLADDGSLVWAPNVNPYCCYITSPKKESKLKGLKSYIAYQISTSNLNVSRRYKHFDWLHQRLAEKFTVIPIPPLPDKQISGRYEESFIEHRRMLLQRWVDRITRHPVLSQCLVWKHFLECIDDKSWKTGKRKAEKDELVGASFFYCVYPPVGYCEPTVENQIENYGSFVRSLDKSVTGVQNVAADQIKKHTGPYKREYQKIGIAFQTLANSFDVNKAAFANSQDFVKAIRNTGEVYDQVALMFEEQPKHDFEPVTDTLHEYKGMLSEFPDILGVHKGALQKMKEMQKLGSASPDCEHRMNVLSYSVLAEMNHLKGEVVVDFNTMMKNFLTAQIQFYDEISQKLRGALEMYQ